jgi:hypothetical protein
MSKWSYDNEPSDQDGDAGDPENYGPASVSVVLRFCRCPVASKPSSTEYEDEGHFYPKLRGRHRLNKNIDASRPRFLTSDAQHIELAGEVAEYDGTVVGCIEFRNRPVKLASSGY